MPETETAAPETAETSETAAETSGVWTAEIRKLLLKCDSVGFRFATSPGAPSYQNKGDLCTLVLYWKEHKAAGKPYRPERRETFAFPGRIIAGFHDAVRPWNDGQGVDYEHSTANTYSPSSGFWGAVGSLATDTPAGAAFALIPIGVKPTFEVYLDGLSNGHMAAVHIHGDRLNVNFTKGERKFSLALDEAIGRDRYRFGHSG